MTATSHITPDVLETLEKARHRMDEMSDILADLLNRVAVFGVLTAGGDGCDDEMVHMAKWQLLESVQVARVKAIRAQYVETGLEGDESRLENLLTRKDFAQNPVVTSAAVPSELWEVLHDLRAALAANQPAAVA